LTHRIRVDIINNAALILIDKGTHNILAILVGEIDPDFKTLHIAKIIVNTTKQSKKYANPIGGSRIT